MIKENTIYKVIGELIRRRRKVAGMTQQVLADRISLSRASITNIEQGRQKLMVHTLVEIAYVLHVSPVDLMPSDNDHLEQPLNDLLKHRTQLEQAWISSAINAHLLKDVSNN